MPPGPEPDRLGARAQRGDAVAFDALCARARPMYVRHAGRLLGRSPDVVARLGELHRAHAWPASPEGALRALERLAATLAARGSSRTGAARQDPNRLRQTDACRLRRDGGSPACRRAAGDSALPAPARQLLDLRGLVGAQLAGAAPAPHLGDPAPERKALPERELRVDLGVPAALEMLAHVADPDLEEEVDLH